MRTTLGMLLVLGVVTPACRPRDAAPRRVLAVGGFDVPESVKWDERQDVYFISNINGDPGDKDNNGAISRLRATSTAPERTFIAGGRNGVTLHAPKGMALVEDTLWVTDIDVVRAFHAVTGAPIAAVPISGAVFLNDLAADPDGSLYVSDTGIRFTASGMEHPGPDRIFRIAPDRRVSVALEGATVNAPNGLAWDRANERLIIVSFAGDSLRAWKPGEAASTVIATGPGQHDGVEVVDDVLWVSSWADSAVYRVAQGQALKAISGVPSPADIGYDAKRRRVLIPIFSEGRVEAWQVR
ncbi:MAG: SMP-30/gluconolactonase/LRE family protein [Gemmatimonadales bacterium]